MKNNYAKRVLALLLTVLMVFSSVPMTVFAQDISGISVQDEAENAVQEETETTLQKEAEDPVPDNITTDPQNVTSAEQLEKAIAAGAEAIRITASFEIDRTFYITKNVRIYSQEAFTLTRKADFAGDMFVIGESAEGEVCPSKITLTVGTIGTQSSDLLTINGNSENMTVPVTGTVFFVCKNGQADLHADLTVTNCKKTGNVRVLDTDKYTLCNDRTIIGGAVGIIAEAGKNDDESISDGVMNIYGGKYTYNGVAESGTYGGAFFNHSTLNVYDGTFEHNYASRAGAFYNYRKMNLHKATVSDNTATSTGGAIYLPSSTGAVLRVGGDTKADAVQVVFKGNKAKIAGAVSSSGTLVLRNTLFEENTATETAGAVYGTGSYNNITVHDSTFTKNSAGTNGGAIYVTSKRSSGKVELHVRDSVFTENSATGNGGAVYAANTSRAYMRDVSFSKNTSDAGGGAAYVYGAEANFNHVTFSENSATAGAGGAVYITQNGATEPVSSSVVMNEVTAQKNTSTGIGGAAYCAHSELKVYNSTIKENTAKSGSAIGFGESGSGDIYNSLIEGNSCISTNEGNAGALYFYTGGTKVTVHSCVLKNNSSHGFGGGILISGKSLLDLYNITATGNSALKGGFMYETVSGTVVTISGLTVSGNSFTEATGAGGPVIWGNTPNAKLYINKTNYIDKDTQAELDDAYWAAAIYNKLTVFDSDAEIPEHDEYDQPDYDTTGFPDVKTAKQLEDAINAGFEKIRILKSFKLDRTYYVTNNTEIYSEVPVVLTRDESFTGDIFVVGEDKNGVATEEEVTLTLGKPDSAEKDMLVIDGNKDNMADDTLVKGSVIFVCSKGNVSLYENLTVRNCKKTGNETALNEAHGLSYPKYVGGAVGIIAKNATMNIYGGSYINNEASMSGSSTYGGAFHNYGTTKVYGGTFSGNSAGRAGAFYNYRVLYIYKATIENNSAVTGGAIYVPASTSALLYIGTDTEGIESNVTFANNTAEGNGGAIYLAGRMTVQDTAFENNSALNGGAIYGGGDYKTITLKDTSFHKNTASENGSAIYLKGDSSYAERYELQLQNTDLSENTAQLNGAVYLSEARANIIDSDFSKNTASNDGAAIYLTSSKLDADTVSFTENSALNGGAVALYENSAVEMTGITSSLNTAASKGGFAYCTNSHFEIFNSSITDNTALTGGAISFCEDAFGGAYSTEFRSNEATGGNGGALDISTSGKQVIIQGCTLTENSAEAFGGAVNAASGSSVKLYDITATNNSAKQGGFMYEADAGTKVTSLGLTVGGNTAEENGPIIFGGSADAVLDISQNKYTDSAASELNEAYWKAAIAGELTVNFTDGEIPPYADYGNEEPGGMWNATDVASADELQAALEAGAKEIRVTKSFELDRTFFITKDVVIFSTAHVTLTRAADFGGDIFVIGQFSDGTPTSETVTLSVGIPTSETSNLFILDGNKSRMTADVTGTVFFVCSNGHAKLYENLTVRNFRKTGNERTLEAVHGVSYPEYIGGAVGILAKNSSMDIYGGTYSNNASNESGKGIYGGAFYNFGTMNVYGGVFSGNRASRAGVFYNYRVLNLYNAEIKNNYAATSGGAIYMPASTGAFLYIGQELDGVTSGVSFTSNSAADNGGAIYANNVIKIKNASFEKNNADNGGAIASYSAALTVEASEFASNTSVLNGAAVYVTGTSSRKNTAELTLDGTSFKSNTSTLSGGAVYLRSEAEAVIGECMFEANSAKADTDENRYGGGAVYVNNASVEFDGTQFINNTSDYNGGAVALYSVIKATLKNITADGNKAENDGGFLYASASAPRIYTAEIKNSSAVNNGGALAFENGSDSQIIKASFDSNSAANGGAAYANTVSGKTFLHSCSFTQNSSANGGALAVAGGSLLEAYNSTAKNNSAEYGGVLYISGKDAKAEINGLSVSGNTASVTGPIIYSDSAEAILSINKKNFTDEAVAGTPDEAYWANAVAGEITLNENENRVPGYAEEGNETFGYMWNATDVASADELEAALKDGKEYIRIVADFELDRTFNVTKSAAIFATKAHKLTRASGFDGVIFSVSTDENAEKTTYFAIGNELATKQDLLTIDGNKNNMTVTVTGAVVEVNEGTELTLFSDFTLTSCSAAPLNNKGEITINGGNYKANASQSDAALMVNDGAAAILGGTFTESISGANGGVILNRGTAVIDGGVFEKNSAVNGGVVYNTSSLEIKSGKFTSNKADNGGAVYNAGELKVSAAEFTSNSAKEKGGAIMAEKSVSVNGAVFSLNKAKKGGAVYILAASKGDATLTAESTSFTSNSADNGGAVYLENESDANFTDIQSLSDSAKENGGFLYSVNSSAVFLEGSVKSASAAKNGGAVYVKDGSLSAEATTFESNSANENGGAISLNGEAVAAELEGCTFTGNSAEDDGGAVYKADKGQLEITDGTFESNKASNGGAVYSCDGSIIADTTELTGNETVKNGGAIALEKKAAATLNTLTAENNKAAKDGGFLYSEDVTLTLSNSTVRSNTAENGGAMMLEGDTVCECTESDFEENSAQNGAAICIKTDKTKEIFRLCTFTSNTAAKNGGAFYIGSGSLAELYENTAKNNSAAYGAVLYETNASTDVTVNGLTVSGNKASKNGYIIYGGSLLARLRINKKNHVDSDEAAALDSAYWAKAIKGYLKVSEITTANPEFGTGAVKVKTAAELEKAINAKKKYILITADFKIDRTFYITSDITIFSKEPHTLTRSEKFGGDIFVVGENAKGEKAFLQSRVVKLTVGNPLSEQEHLLTINGNSSKMTNQVYGSVFFVTYGGQVELYDNLTVTNCFKQGNERTGVAAYKLSRPTRIGGSVAIVANGSLTVHGGNYTNNKVNEEDSSTEEGRNSSIGGVFYNASNLIIRDGNFIGNEAARGGIVYNYKNVRIYAGTFKNNIATRHAAVYYAPSSPPCQLIIGSTDEDAEKVLIKNNTSKGNGGVIYSSHYSAVLIYGNTSFKNNEVLSGSGGAIYVVGALTVKNSEFIGNKASDYGGAVYLSRSNNDEITRLMHFEGCSFKENQAKNGGAITMNSSAAKSYSKGSIATVEDCLFYDNLSTSAGGAVYTDNLSKLTVDNSSFIENTSKGEAGAMYFIGKSRITLNNSIFDANEAASHGGAITVRSAYVDINGGEIRNSKAAKNGGAMYIAYSSAQNINSHVNIKNVNVRNNTGSGGGAFYVTRRSIEPDAVLLNVKSSAFEGNTAKSSGGAILLTAGVKTYFADVSFTANNASANGGAVQVGGSSLFEIDKGSFKNNTSKEYGGAISLSSGGTALMNKIEASGNTSRSLGGFLYSDAGVLKLYDSTVSGNAGSSGGAMYLAAGAVNGIYKTAFSSNTSSSTSGNGGALFIYAGDTDTTIHSCSFTGNESQNLGGAMYISGVSKVKLYNTVAKQNKALKGGFMYETKAGTVVDLIGLEVSGNSAAEGGSIIWGNTKNATLNIDKSKYTDKNSEALDDAYWATAIEGLLTVKNTKGTVPTYESYESKKETTKPATTKTPVSVEDVFTLAKKSSDADIDEKYNKLKKLDNSSNFMSRATKDYPNINGKTVTVDTFVYPTKGKTDNGIVGLGILLYQALAYKKANPKQEMYIDVSSYRFSVQSAVNINRNSRYFGYMRNLVGKNYDEYGFVRLSYLLITAAKMGIHVNVIGQLDAYPISSSNPNFYNYFTMQLSDPCDPKYAKGKVIGDYLDFNFCYWTLDAKGGTDMMHTKMCTVSHYLDMNGVAHKNAVWSSSSNLDGVKADGQNANWKLQTASLVTNHDDLYRVSTNYLRLISSLCGQEEVIEFQETVNSRSTEQIALISQGRGNEIPADKQIVYIGTPKDDVFELYFTPFGGNRVAWDEVHNPYCKYVREMYESEDYILFTWNAAEYSGRFVLGTQIEDMIIKSFHDNRDVRNKIYSYMESFDPTTFDDLVVGKDIGYKSFFEKPFGKVHNKDVQLSYVKNGQRYFVTLLNSLNLHSGSMSYQSNFVLVVKEKSCDENGVFSTIARYSTTGDIAAHTYGEEKTYKPSSKKDGYTYRECIYCGHKNKTGVAHNPGEWIIDKKATTTQNGLRHNLCTVCGEIVKAEEVPRKTVSMYNSKVSGRTFTSSSAIALSSKTMPLTLEARIQVPKNMSSRAGVIVGNYGASGDILNLEVYKNGKIKLYLKKGSKVFSHVFSKDIRSYDPVDIAVVLSSGTAVLYVDGVKKDSVKLTVSLPSSLKSLKIGGDNRSKNTQYFKGRIYSVNLFSAARTLDNIKKDNLIVSPDTPKLIYTGYYDSNDACAVQLDSRSFTAKKLKKINAELPSVAKTIEATIQLPKSFNGRGGVIFGNYSESYKAPFNLEVYTKGRLRLYYKYKSTTVSHIFKTDIRSDDPVNIAITIDGKTAILYVNGVKKETAKLAASLPAAKKNLCIGGDNRKNNERYFRGKIYSLNLFSDVRTASEIKKDAIIVPSNASKLMYSAYITAANNSSTYEKAALTGQTFSKSIRYGIPSLLSGTPHTFEATLQLSKKVSKEAGIILSNNGSGSANKLTLSVYTNGRPKLHFTDGKKTVTHTFKTDIRTSSTAVNLAITVSGKTATLYLNGVKKETASLSRAIPTINEGFIIGGDNTSSNSNYFKGRIYSVNLFSDVRTASEIKKDARLVTAKAPSLLYSAYFCESKCDITAYSKSHTASSWKTVYKAGSAECGVKYKKCTCCGEILRTYEVRKTGAKFADVNYGALQGRTFDSNNKAIAVDKKVSGKGFTVETTVNLSTSTSKRAGTILGNYDGSSSDQFNIEVYTDGKVRIYYKVKGTAYNHVFSPDIRSKGKTHIALTVEGKKVNLFINGKLKETYTSKVSLPSSISKLKIGSDNRSGGNYFLGTMYSMYIFDGVRSSKQIAYDRYAVLSDKPYAVYSGLYK